MGRGGTAHPPAHPTGNREAALRGVGAIRTGKQVSSHPALPRILTESESVLFPKDTAFETEQGSGPYKEGVLMVAFQACDLWPEENTAGKALGTLG